MRRRQPQGPRLIALMSIILSALHFLSLSLIFHSGAAAQESAAESVAVTDRFVFYSRFSLNLHDRLRHTAVVAEAERSACLPGLPEEDGDAWDRAVQQYREVFGAREGRRLALLHVRMHLAGFREEVEAELGPMPEEVQRALEAGTAAYRACWWTRDDQANRRWINALVEMVEEVGEALAARLAEAYQTPWKAGRIPVDVVPYAGRTGASTVSPDHILIASSDEDIQGRAALEMIFHEASHTIIGPRAGEPSRYFREAADQLSVEVPRDLWHVVLFYTTGEVVRKVIADKYGEEYLPYLYATGLFERAWPEYQQPLEQWWRPYLQGELQISQAAAGVLRALSK